MTYSVGLDIGTGSVGWAVLTEEGKLARAKGKNLIGVRLFETAETAADRRGNRTTRRRLSRRAWRLESVASLFAVKLNQIDSNFLARQKYAYVHPADDVHQDHYYGGYLFPTRAETQNFHKKYPTIYHLRHALMMENEKFDLRLVYQALHHLIKYRGHFLNTQAKMAAGSIEKYDPTWLQEAIQNYATAKDLTWSLNEPQVLTDVLVGPQGFGLSKSTKAEELLNNFSFDSKEDKEAIHAILKGIVGNEANLAKVFKRTLTGEDLKKWKVKFDSENIDLVLEEIMADLDDDELILLEAIRSAFDGFTLMNLLGEETSVSAAMIARYNQHKKDRSLVKRLMQDAGQSHREFSAVYHDFLLAPSNSENEKKIQQATVTIQKLIKGTDLPLSEKEEKLSRIDSHDFLPKQRAKANSVIPYQLHLAELEKIIENQGKYYPFLLDTFTNKSGETVNKIVQLLKFRVPYYVGPLVTKENVLSSNGDATNHWVTRRQGQEKTLVTPWNFDQVFDRDQAAQDFIKRLTGTDTYLIGEETLPKNSLQYQLFTVLNELNNVRIDGRKMDAATKKDLIQSYFKVKKTVTAKNIQDYYLSQGQGEVTVSGLADKTKFNSSLSAYIDLSKTFTGEYLEDPANLALLEKIIQIQTVFEDAEIAHRELAKLDLTDDQVNHLAQTHYTGWGNLSKKLLTSKMIAEGHQHVSILDKLQTTSKNFMAIINHDEYGVQDWIKDQNVQGDGKQTLQERINELTTSPANKRGIKQALNVLSDIKKAMRVEPDRVYLEFARETQNSVQTVSRYNALKAMYQSKSLTSDLKELKKDLNGHNQKEFSDDRLYLYFQQQGKDMYTGQAINIDQISTHYDIDHIIPQAYTKDDSLENRVLVARPENARKSDSATYTQEVQAKAGALWRSLRQTDFISQKKFDRLTQTGDYSEGQKTGFIARQLVETRQIIKNVAALIESEFNQTQAVAIRAEITADMRKLVSIKKHREINSFHHAFDALLITAAGQYMQARYPDRDGANVYDEFDRYTNDYLKNLRKTAASDIKRRLKPFGFVVGTMAKGNENWSVADTEYLRKVMNYKNILTTKRTGKDRGPLYKQTIYAPGAKAKLIATGKSRENLTLYGGYDYPYSAYMALVRSNGKNLVVKVSRAAASQIKSGQINLTEYIQSLPEVKKFEKVLIERMPLGQLINEDGKLTLLSSNEIRLNAKQLWLSTFDADLVSQAVSLPNENIDYNEQCIRAFDILTSSAVKNRFPFYNDDIDKLTNLRDEFNLLPKKVEVLKTILSGLQLGSPFKGPVKKIKKTAKEWKKHQEKGGIKLSDNTEIIYQSTTGIFEKRIKIKDLL